MTPMNHRPVHLTFVGARQSPTLRAHTWVLLQVRSTKLSPLPFHSKPALGPREDITSPIEVVHLPTVLRNGPHKQRSGACNWDAVVDSRPTIIAGGH